MNALDRCHLLHITSYCSLRQEKLACQVAAGQQTAVKILRQNCSKPVSLPELKEEVVVMKCHIIKLSCIPGSEVSMASRLGALGTALKARGTLEQCLRMQVKFLFRQSLLAVHCCRMNHVSHRDLKLDDLLLNYCTHNRGLW